MGERSGTYAVLILYTVALMFLFYTAYFDIHVNLPEGCDEFGYLNMAKAISQGNLFKNHAERPFDRGLLEHLKKSTFDYISYVCMICPHAYFLHHKKFKITNQYPPGTSIVLSVLPFTARKTGYPAVCGLLIVLFLVLAFKAGAGALSFLSVNLIAVITFMAFMSDYIHPGMGNYSWVNSHAPTFGMLIAAGYLLDKRPGISIALLGTSTLFRISNVILFVPFLVVYVWKGFSIGDYFSKETLLKTIKAIVFLLVGGLGFYYIYIWLLLGNPLETTYPDFYLKASIASIKEIPGNIGYNMNFYNQWFLFHLAVIVPMVCMLIFKKMPAKWVIVSIAIALFNYCFYIVHHRFGAIEQRYVYASGMIASGILLRYAEEYMRNVPSIRRIINYAGEIIIVAAAVFSVLHFPRPDMRQQIADQIKNYNDCFSGYDVVWAELRSGTLEYATGKAGFRYGWGSAAARKDVMSWLHDHGYRQAIWVSDLEKSAAEQKWWGTMDVEGEIKSIPLDYTVKSCSNLGTVIDIQ